MKKVVLLFFCAAVLYCAHAQQHQPEKYGNAFSKQDYLHKNKSQKAAAIVLISVGGALVIGGTAVAATGISNSYNIDPYGIPYYDNSNDNETVAGVLIVTGIAAIVASIPLFVSAHKNRKRAMALSFKNERAPQLQRHMVFYKSVPSLSFKIPL